MGTLEGRTIFMSGGSRGIGRAIALRAARDGANVVIAAKTDEPHEKLPGTIHTVAEEVREAGGQALPLKVDIRDEDRVAEAVSEAVEHFGGIDVVVNNASAIRLTGTEQTPVKRYDLLHQINGRGTFVMTQACLPHLKESDNPHVLTLAPPLDLARKWFAPFPPYVITKFTMSLFTHAWAGEYGGEVSCNALWPRTAIKTAAVEFEIDAEMLKHSRTPEIMADAAHVILTQPKGALNGRFLIDDEVLMGTGNGDMDAYAVEPGQPLAADFMVEPTPGMMGLGDM